MGLQACGNRGSYGVCHVTHQTCSLSGNLTAYECGLRGAFDVWIRLDNAILLSDIGPPSPEAKQLVALGVTKELAGKLALETARSTKSRIVTTQLTCRHCGGHYWITDHDSMDTPKTGRRTLCPHCVKSIGMVTGPIADAYWCG